MLADRQFYFAARISDGAVVVLVGEPPAADGATGEGVGGGGVGGHGRTIYRIRYGVNRIRYGNGKPCRRGQGIKIALLRGFIPPRLLTLLGFRIATSPFPKGSWDLVRDEAREHPKVGRDVSHQSSGQASRPAALHPPPLLL